MMASEAFLAGLVTVAVVVTLISPVALLVLLVRDFKRGRVW